MKIAIAFDHRGVGLRTAIVVELMSGGHEVLDLGTDSTAPEVDSVSKAIDVAEAIVAGRVERGVIVAWSGIGTSFAANKVDGIRAGACSNVDETIRSIADGMNVLCLGSGTVDKASAAAIVCAFASDGGIPARPGPIHLDFGKLGMTPAELRA